MRFYWMLPAAWMDCAIPPIPYAPSLKVNAPRSHSSKAPCYAVLCRLFGLAGRSFPPPAPLHRRRMRVLLMTCSTFPGHVQVEDLSTERNISAPALAADGIRAYHPTVRNAFRLWPHTFRTAGFFAARFRKIHPIQPDKKSFRERAVPNTGPTPRHRKQFGDQFFWINIWI